MLYGASQVLDAAGRRQWRMAYHARIVLTVIHQLLDSQQLQGLNAWLDSADWADGRSSAGPVAALAKRNQQVSEQSPGIAEQRSALLAALAGNLLFQTANLPARYSPPLFACYQPGMRYDEHTDNALMLNGALRGDVAYTVFLSAPETYEGGELVISSDQAPASVKLAAGSVVAYSAATLHRVNPVTQGARRVAVGWLQSHVREAAQRALLLDLARAIGLLQAQQAEAEAIKLLEKSRQNLLRMWA